MEEERKSGGQVEEMDILGLAKEGLLWSRGGECRYCRKNPDLWAGLIVLVPEYLSISCPCPFLLEQGVVWIKPHVQNERGRIEPIVREISKILDQWLASDSHGALVKAHLLDLISRVWFSWIWDFAILAKSQAMLLLLLMFQGPHLDNLCPKPIEHALVHQVRLPGRGNYGKSLIRTKSNFSIFLFKNKGQLVGGDGGPNCRWVGEWISWSRSWSWYSPFPSSRSWVETERERTSRRTPVPERCVGQTWEQGGREGKAREVFLLLDYDKLHVVLTGDTSLKAVFPKNALHVTLLPMDAHRHH